MKRHSKLGISKLVVIILGFVVVVAIVVLYFIYRDGSVGADINSSGQEYAPGRILVKFKPNVNFYKKNKFISDYHLKIKKVISGIGINVMELPASGTEKEYEKAFKMNKDVENASLDYAREPSLIPSDPFYSNQWHLPKISAPAAWDQTTGSTSIIIAILDTGVYPSHTDLQQVAGWNVISNNSDTSDIRGHGTAVAGTAAAVINNSTGVASICGNCKIMPIRITNDSASGLAYDSDTASGLIWAADHGAKVASNSYRTSDSYAVQQAARYFKTKGGLLTVSAGNQAELITSPDVPEIITVGATDRNDNLASFSNRGNIIDVTAPGVDIYTTANLGGYRYASGTSFSAPATAGVLGMIFSANPSLTPAQAESILESSTDDLGSSGWDQIYGWGRVNLQKAVTAALAGPAPDTQPPSVSFNQPANGATVSGNLSIRVEARDNVFVSSAILTLDGTVSLNPTSTQKISDMDIIYNYSLDTNTISNGTHLLSAKAFDSSSNSNTSNISINVSNVADTTPPTVSIISPTNNLSLRGAKTSISVSATDNVGVSRVELFIDNVLVRTFTSTPYNFSWNIRKVASGSHTIYARAYDAKGNMGTSATITVIK